MKFKKVKINASSYLVNGNYNMELKYFKSGKISVNYRPWLVGNSKKFKLSEEDSFILDRKLRNVDIEKIENNKKTISVLDGEELKVSIFYDDASTKEFNICMPYTKYCVKFLDAIKWVINKGEINSGV